jgi:hypothetical protein
MSEDGRWWTYVLESGIGVQRLLSYHVGQKNRDVCFILGAGFDPRMNLGLRALVEAGGDGRRQLMVLRFDEGASSPSHAYVEWSKENLEELSRLSVEGKFTSQEKELQMFAADGRRIGSRSAANLFRTVMDLEGFTDIILDVSSLPQSIFCPLVAKLLYLQKKCEGRPPNLFVLAADNTELDVSIVNEGVDEDADYIHLFRSGRERISAAREPTVWVPVLGEHKEVQLERLHELVAPNEICPLLPSPSQNPRRGDQLLIEYRELLFSRLRVEPLNILYAAEQNPFEVYRQVRQTILHYQRALNPLGGCHPVVSSVSTKLLSLGTLLAAYELKVSGTHVGIAHIESHGYRVENETLAWQQGRTSTLFAMWLAGDCYE